jgi:hypothetical protein
LLLPPRPRKSKQLGLPPPLETLQDCRLAEERDRALTKRAKRLKSEAAADRARFELTRDKVVFAVELAVAMVALIAMVLALVANPGLIPMALVSGVYMARSKRKLR